MEVAAPRTLKLRVVRDAAWPTEVVPVVDGRTLTDLVGDFERSRGYEPAGGYAGLVADRLPGGGLATHLVARGASTAVLSCDCGEPGCWPLEAAVTAVGERVTWSHFRQPHRPAWDYSGFGPFTFDRTQYDAAVAEAVEALRDGGA